MRQALARVTLGASVGILVLGYTACFLFDLYATYLTVKWIIEGHAAEALLFGFVGVPLFTVVATSVVGAVAAVVGYASEWLQPKEDPEAQRARKRREGWEADFPDGLPEGFGFNSEGELVPIEETG
jgi:hypothetical protein